MPFSQCNCRPESWEKAVFSEQEAAFSETPPSPCPTARGHPLVGGAEDEESTGFWNGHRLLLQLQLGELEAALALESHGGTVAAANTIQN